MDMVNALCVKVRNLSQFVQKNSSKYIALFSLVFAWFLMLSVYDSYANAQADVPKIDVMQTWADCSDHSEIGTTDTGSNMQTLTDCDNVARLLSYTSFIVGTDVYGEAAQLRAEEIGAEPSMRVGALGMADSAVTAMIYSPPGVNIPAHLARQWIPGSETGSSVVYAQETGYAFLQTLGVETLWEMFRNMAYAGFVLILMVAGFMIMFRSKIGGQTAVSVINTIPGVVFGLILVTFSFAIVGFIIDLGRLFTGIIGAYMQDKLASAAPGFEVTALGDPLNMAYTAFNAGVDSLSQDELNRFGGVFVGTNILKLFFWQIFGKDLVGLFWILLVVFIAAVSLYAAIRVYVTLIMAYIKIFIDLILGPLYILLGSLPGKSSMTVDWIKRIFASVLVFPVVFFIINLGRFIGYSTINTGVAGAVDFMSGGQAGTPMMRVQGIFVIACYMFAASAPSLIQDMLSVAESRGTSSAMESTKKAMSKIPLVGGLMG